MNATDILGEILRGGFGGEKPRKGGGRSSGDILGDILRGGRRSEQSPSSPPPTDAEIARQARELEEMLGVGRHDASPSPTKESDWTRSAPPARGSQPPPLPDRSRQPAARLDAEAQILIRAMIQAAKADGRLTRDEQSAIIERLGGDSREARAFLKRELEAATDVRDFAWSVPLGMEFKVYSISLGTIELDSRGESEYLKQLAHGLRLPREVCAQVHQRYGAPPLSE